jgi:hypothetical protein
VPSPPPSPVQHEGSALPQQRPQSAQFIPTVFVGAIIQILILFVVLVVLALKFPAGIGGIADPLNQKMFQPRPEWYFLSLFQMLKAFAGPWEIVGTVLIPLVAIVALVALPYYDRRPERRARRRPVAMTLFWGLTLFLTFLTWQSEGSPLPFARTGAAPSTGTAAGARPTSSVSGHATPAYTTADAVVLAATAGGSPVAHLQIDTPLTVVAQKGANLQVTLNAWMRQGATTVFYVDTGGVGSAMQAGSLAEAVPKPLATKTDPATGVVWQKVVLGGWVAAAQTAPSDAALWTTASQQYSNSCGVCHALHATTQFTALQWAANVKAMGPRTALTKTQLDLVLKYLQWHASDTTGKQK